MGKIRTRMLGLEDIEKQQKEEQKKRSSEKKSEEGVVEEATEQVKKVEKKEKKSSNAAPAASKKGKKLVQATKKVDASKKYSLDEALKLLKDVSYATFDSSIELHCNLDKEGLKGEVALPYTTGKSVRVAVVDDALLDKLAQGVIEFDVLVTHPSFMPKLARFAKVLGPRGLMPNPKAGTVSPRPEEVVEKFQKGTLRWKAEAKFPLLHQMVGKMSHDSGHIVENIRALVNAIGKPHITSAYVKSTMSPSIQLDIEML